MLLFQSEEWVDKWCKGNNLERGEVLTLHQVWELSKLWYHNRLLLEYHGLSIEQVAEDFRQVGLMSDFWYIQR